VAAQSTVDDDPYASLPDSPSAAGATPRASEGVTPQQKAIVKRNEAETASPLDAPTGEGTYWMRDKSGAGKKIPYSRVGRAANAGYTLIDKDKYINDVRFDPKVAGKGVEVVGLNAAGQPIFGSSGHPEGSAKGRFGSSLWEQLKAPVTGVYHAFADAPRTPEEAEFQANQPAGNLGFKRLLYDPSVDQFHKFQKESNQANWRSTNPTDEERSHQSLAIGHLLGTLPLVGPAAAQIGEKLGQQVGVGDYAGAAGTATGVAAWEAAPKLATKAIRSGLVTETIPKEAVTHLIKPLKGDLAFGKDPAAAILDNGITAWTLDGLGDKVSQKLGEVGAEIDRTAQSPRYASKRINVGDALKPFDEAIQKAEGGPATPAKTKLYKRLVEARTELYQDFVATSTKGGKPTMLPVGPKNMVLSPYEALQFKRAIGDSISWTEDPIQGELNKAYAASYRITKDGLNNELGEDFAKLNERYSDLVGAAKAIQRRIPIAKRNAHWSLTDVVLGTHSIPMAVARKVGMLPIARTAVPVAMSRLPGVVPELGMAGSAALVSPALSQPKQEQKRNTSGSRTRVPTDTTAPPTATEDDPYASLPDSPGGGSASSLGDAISGEEDSSDDPYSVPKMANNPGSLELKDVGHGTMPAANNQKITIFGSPEEGRAALDRQLNLILSGKDSKYPPSMTLEQFGKVYSGGDAGYGGRIAAKLGVDPSTTLGQLAQSQSAAPTPEIASTPAPAPVPLPAAKAAVAARKPAPAKPSPATPAQAPNPPNKNYRLTATGPNSHRIGSDNGATWFDIQTGRQVN
jgi:hypothetical protein